MEPDRFRDAEQRVARAAPQLQRVLAGALAEGGWLDSSREQQLAQMLELQDPAERMVALRTLLAEEGRLGMMVGVVVGWELGRELEGRTES